MLERKSEPMHAPIKPSHNKPTIVHFLLDKDILWQSIPISENVLDVPSINFQKYQFHLFLKEVPTPPIPQ